MPSNKLFGLENVIFSPHMAGVTKEASDRMAQTAIENILSVFDGRPNAAHVVNKEVLGCTLRTLVIRSVARRQPSNAAFQRNERSPSLRSQGMTRAAGSPSRPNPRPHRRSGSGRSCCGCI